MDLKLVRPAWEYEEQVMAYREAMFASGDSFDGCAGLEACWISQKPPDAENRRAAPGGDLQTF